MGLPLTVRCCETSKEQRPVWLDTTSQTLCWNRAMLRSLPDWACLFATFWTLRRAEQLYCPNRFATGARRGLLYEVLDDGTSCKWNGQTYEMCRVPLPCAAELLVRGTPWCHEASEYAMQQTCECIEDDAEREAVHAMAYWYGKPAPLDEHAWQAWYDAVDSALAQCAKRK